MVSKFARKAVQGGRRNPVQNMWRVAALVAALLCANLYCAFGQTIRVTTWNLHWFPAGSQNRVPRAVEEERISAAAEQLKILHPDVVLLQEIRDWDTCERLITALKPIEYHTLVCSAFRDSFGGGVGKQQVAILAKRWAQAAWSESWTRKGKLDPPRGFAFTAIRYGEQDIGFYSLHLKSNLVRASGDLEAQLNIAKRELAAEQLVAHIRAIETNVLPSVRHIVVGGDFNTNRDQPIFVSERTLATMMEAGFADAFAGIPLSSRITHPGSGRYPDATFDYFFVKNLKLLHAPIVTESKASDHRPVTCDFQLPVAR